MKKFMISFFAMAGMVFAFPALAQDYHDSPKGNDGERLMKETERSELETETQAPVQQTETTATQASSIEPVAGYASTSTTTDNFTGPYAGADIGYSWGGYDVNDPAGPDGEADMDGWEGGLFAGYGFTPAFNDFQAYAGLELGYEWSGADDSVGGNNFEKDHSWLITFRPGVVLDEAMLSYGIIGYNRGTFEDNGQDETLNGLALGVGAEFAVMDPLRMRLEYAYTNFEDGDFSGVNFDGHENNLKVGALYRF